VQKLCVVDCLPWKLAGRSALTAASRGGDAGGAASAATPQCPCRARSPGTFALEADRLEPADRPELTDWVSVELRLERHELLVPSFAVEP
jgi:hypothetical protein